MDDNCGEWVECMSVASGCGYQEMCVASGWNVWVWLCVVFNGRLTVIAHVHCAHLISIGALA